jgi:hypothetical protein
MDITSSVIVAFDYKEDSDNAVLLVGQKNTKQDVAIINAFQGGEAKELWKKLTAVKEKK